jgi:hypothetical protein
MADDELPERSDPVLVRPYITTEPGSAREDRSAERWPEEAALPETGTSEFAAVTDPGPQPAPGSKSSALLRQRLFVLGGVLVLAIVAAGFVLFGASGDEDSTPPPAARPTLLPEPSTVNSPGAAPLASGATRSVPASSRSADRSPSAAAGTTRASQGAPAVPPPAGGSAPPAATAPTPTLVPPPEVARVGAITAASGRCLIMGGLFGIDGSPVQVTGCADVSYQKFTLATDGTLQVAGNCAEVTGDGSVRTNDCDDRESEQWRAGPNNSLVNPESGKCLTDPGSVGANTRAETCTGATNQTWTLP